MKMYTLIIAFLVLAGLNSAEGSLLRSAFLQNIYLQGYESEDSAVDLTSFDGSGPDQSLAGSLEILARLNLRKFSKGTPYIGVIVSLFSDRKGRLQFNMISQTFANLDSVDLQNLESGCQEWLSEMNFPGRKIVSGMLEKLGIEQCSHMLLPVDKFKEMFQLSNLPEGTTSVDINSRYLERIGLEWEALLNSSDTVTNCQKTTGSIKKCMAEIQQLKAQETNWKIDENLYMPIDEAIKIKAEHEALTLEKKKLYLEEEKLNNEIKDIKNETEKMQLILEDARKRIRAALKEIGETEK